MEKQLKQIYADLFFLHDKIHTYHIKTVRMPGCATLHSTLGDIYTALETIVDSRGEDVIQKYLGEDVPSGSECYDLCSFTDGEAQCACDIVAEIYSNINDMEMTLQEFLNDQENDVAQLVGPVWQSFTGFCAALEREMEEDEEENDED